MAEPPSYSAHVSASADRRCGGEMTQFVEVSCNANLLCRPLVVVRQSVGDERLGAGCHWGEDEGVRHRIVPTIDA